MQEVDDWELVARAQGGDMNAFAEIVRRYQTPVIHFCQRMLGSAQDAEDMAQDCFMRLHRYLDRLQPQAKFSTVLFGMARQLTLNHLRDTKRRGRGQHESVDVRPVPASINAHPDRQARLREIEGALEEGLARLSAEHREVLVLREIQGMDYDAIAAVVHCRKGTVKSRLARAREQLRQQLVALGGEAL